MIHDLEPYPAYKDSGVPWLAEVPSHWDVERAKWLFSKMDRPIREEDEVVTCFRDGVVTLRRNRRVSGFTESLKEIGYQGIRRGDLVIHAMDAFAGAVGVADSDGKSTPVYSICKPEAEADSHYYAFLVREMARNQWIVALAKGIRERSTDFRFDSFASQPVPVPPLPEQATIVRFLDQVDRRIRRYIRAKQKLIKLLEEQKQAIIHRAVTRGLDPDVRLKPSGVEWLGEIPLHWEVRKLGQLARVFNGTTPSRLRPQYWENGTVPWVSSSKVNDHVVLEPSEFITKEALRETALSIVPKGAVILGLVGQGKTRGMSAYLAIDSCINQNLAAIVPRNGLAGQFLHYQLTAFYRFVREGGRGGNQAALNCEIVSSQRLPIPPLEEQLTVIAYLARELDGLGAVSKNAQREIDLLQEYRTRLIADVVTGKLDVREAASRLPDEDETGPLDDVDALEVGGAAAEEAS